MMTSQKSKNHFWRNIQLNPLFLLFIVPFAVQAAGNASEIWISARTNALGTSTMLGNGSITNPYYGDFDFIINRIPTNTTEHLLAGVFYTKGNQADGDPILRQGQKLVGSGINVTVIRRDQRFHFQDGQNTAVLGYADGITVSNLTIDCNNITGTNAFKGDGINLCGNSCVIQWVQVVNSSGSWLNGQEDFAIVVGNGGETNVLTTNNLIANCEVSSVKGNYTTAITVAGQGVIEFCSVIFTNPILGIGYLDNGFGAGYQADATSRSIIISNSCVGGGNGFYNDTYSNTNLAIEYNNFQCIKGIYLNVGSPWTVDGLTIRGNRIELRSNSASQENVNGIDFLNNTTNIQYSHVMIAGNTISGVNVGSGMSLRNSAYLTNVNNILWTTNVASSGNGMISMQNCSNTLTANNLVYGNGGNVNGIAIEDPSTSSDVVLNNIVMGCNLKSIYVQNTACISVCDSNLFYPFANDEQTLAQWQSAGFDNHSVFADPLVANANTGDFQLTSNSPAIAQALNLTADGITNDASGNSRPATGNWDMGAYEFVVSPPVSPPTRLQVHGFP